MIAGNGSCPREVMWLFSGREDMKYLGLLCMATAAVAGGFLMAGEWEMRVKLLGIFRQMAVYLKARIMYSNETLPEALKEVGNRFADESSGMAAEAGLFFLRVEKRMEEEKGSRRPSGLRKTSE